MSNILDSDLLLVQRGNTSYKATGADLFGSIPSGGAWNLVATVNADAAATVDFPNLINDYDQYVLVGTDVRAETGNPEVRVQLMNGTDADNEPKYDSVINEAAYTSGPDRRVYALQQYFKMWGAPLKGTTGEWNIPLNFNIWIPGGNLARNNHMVYWTGSAHNDGYSPGGVIYTFGGCGLFTKLFIANGIRFSLTTSKLSGTFKLYGLS